MIDGNAPAYLEACRLAREFFPESRGYITDAVGFDWDSFGGAMQLANYKCDYIMRRVSP